MEWSAIIAALIGAAIGSLGAQWLGETQRRRQDREATKRQAAVKHLVPLQDALESLWFRLESKEPEKAEERDHEYYEKSSLYLIANALAQIRLLVVEGAYAELRVFNHSLRRGWGTRGVWRVMGETHPDFSYPEHLERSLDRAEKAIGAEAGSGISFFRYQRRGLADRMIPWDGGWRVLNYAEFVELCRKREESSIIDSFLSPAEDFVDRLGVDQRQQGMIMRALQDALWLIEVGTEVKLPPKIQRAIKAFDDSRKESQGIEFVDRDVRPTSDLRDWRNSRYSRPPKDTPYKSCTVLLAYIDRPEAGSDLVEKIYDINKLILEFDQLVDPNKGSIKVETMGDRYLAVSGVPPTSPTDHAAVMCDLAMKMQAATPDRFALTIGLHSGELKALVLSKDEIAYLLWNETAKEARQVALDAPSNEIWVTEAVSKAIGPANGKYVFEAITSEDDPDLEGPKLLRLKSHG